MPPNPSLRTTAAYASAAHSYAAAGLPAPPVVRERPDDRPGRARGPDAQHRDPWDRSRAREALADEVLPHQFSFASLYYAINGLYATSRRDEALLNSREHAQVMWRDGSCWPLIEERKAPVLGLPWAIEPTDPKDQDQLRVAGELTDLVHETPRLDGVLDNLLDAEWFGACAEEWIPAPSVRVGRKYRWGVEDHFQVEGDKLNWTWGREPGIYVHGSYRPDDATIVSGNEGHVLLLDRPKWRDKFCIHKFQCKDFSYLYEAQKAIGAVGGVGLRGRLYWPWNLWKELQAWWWSGMETFGSNGNWLYYYQQDNPAQRDAMREVAQRMGRNVHILIPKFPDFPKDSPQVENVPPTNVKFEEMREAMEFLRRWMRSIVLGGNPEEDSAGSAQGKVPEASEGQRQRLMRLDAKGLGETLTRQWLRPYLLKYNEWEYRKRTYPGDRLPFALRWRFQIEDDAEKNLAKLATYEKVLSIFIMQAQSGMPWPFSSDQLLDDAGIAAPKDEELQHPKQGMMGGMMPGSSPGPGMPGTGAGGAGPGGHAPGPNGNGFGRVPQRKPSNGMGNGKAPGGAHGHAGGTGIGRPHVAQKVAQAGARPDRFARSEHVPTVAVDLDGTICEYDGWRGEDHFGAVRAGAAEALAGFQRRGWRVIIFTTRGNTGNVAAFLDREGIPYDFINENPDQPAGTNPGKVIADVYLDDRAVDARRDWSELAKETEQRLLRLGRREGQDDAPPDPGVMVAWFLPTDLARQISVPGGEPPEELHVTLAYLGRLSDLGEDDEAQAHAVLMAQAAVAQALDEFGREALEGSIGGLGFFPPEERHEGRAVCFVPVDVPGLEDLRQLLVARLEAAGLPVARDHGFTPHVTLSYLEDGEAGPAGVVGPYDARVESVAVVCGEERVEVPLAEPGPQRLGRAHDVSGEPRDETGRWTAGGPGGTTGGMDTPEFQDWFAGSKVVGKSGKPLVVYHGSDEPIDDFQAVGDSKGVVAYFSTDGKTSKGARKFGDVVTPAYLRVEKPLDLRSADTGVPGKGHTFKQWMRVFRAKGVDTSKFEYDHAFLEPEDLPDGLDADLFYWSFIDTDKGFVGPNSNVVEELKRQGFDGVIAKEEGRNTIAVFDPGQIRLADAGEAQATARR